MKSHIISVLGFTVLLAAQVCLASQATDVSWAKKAALVISCSRYTGILLKHPSEDADLVAQTLEARGFTVTRLDNPDVALMDQGVAAFSRTLEKGGVGLIYFSGMSMHFSNGENLLLMANTNASASVHGNRYPVGRLTRIFGEIQTALNIMIFDAAYRSPTPLPQGAQHGLSNITLPPDSIISYAASPGETVSERPTKHNLFATHLVTALNSPGATTDDIFKHLRKKVVMETNGEQIPWEASSLMSQLRFLSSTDNPEGSSWRCPVTGMTFLWIQGGCFSMGLDSQPPLSSSPAHSVCVDGFWLSEHEVTQQAWLDIMGNNPSYFKRGGRYPVESITWDEAQLFTRKLSELGKAAYRLPTEAEWEYACTGGGAWSRYCGSETAGDVGWYGGNSRNSTHPVCEKKSNSFGLCDMTGNVGEWVSDWYSAYYSTVTDIYNPQGPPGGKLKIVRGGAWISRLSNLRAQSRSGIPPDLMASTKPLRGWAFGMRLVRSTPDTAK